jgi:hypothetical protein
MKISKERMNEFIFYLGYLFQKVLVVIIIYLFFLDDSSYGPLQFLHFLC